MKPIVITVTCYGFTYVNLFLTQLLKSLLDLSNLPTIAYRVQFVIFTDDESKPMIMASPNFMELLEVLSGNVRFEKLVWTEKTNTDDTRYSKRYARLTESLRRGIKIALDDGAWLIPLCADHVVAQKFFKKILDPMDRGICDSVFVQPIRAAAEAAIPRLDSFHRAYPAEQLCKLAFAVLHPVWEASYYETTRFTQNPYVLIWGSETGLLVRSFPVTPIIFQPTTEMIDVDGVIDLALPQYCHAPYWASNWDDAPIINVDPLSSHFPAGMPHMSSIEYIKSWAKVHVPDKRLFKNLEVEFYYPNKTIANIHPEMIEQSRAVVRELMT